MEDRNRIPNFIAVAYNRNKCRISVSTNTGLQDQRIDGLRKRICATQLYLYETAFHTTSDGVKFLPCTIEIGKCVPDIYVRIVYTKTNEIVV